ncbi:hypothetical protein FOA52_008141 [Chlamydomonas sp. UWO 241]|nr:hypothetical protein FOA52_008141 [Chlamydomonas sp. UWO 241]
MPVHKRKREQQAQAELQREEEEEESGDEDGEEEEEEDEVIAEATVNDGSTRSAYKFSFKANRDAEYGAHLELVGTVVHKKDGAVGSLKGSLIDRSLVPRDSFHEICDARSRELQGIGTTFCDDSGKVRFDSVLGLSETGDSSASFGDFAHIDMVKLNEAHRHSDVGLRFVRACLDWLSGIDLMGGPPWHQGWSLAAVLPGRATTDSGYAAMMRHWGGEAPAESKAERKEREAREDAQEAEQATGLRKIRLQFVRLGFQQAGRASELFWVTPCTLTSKGATPSKRRDPRDQSLEEFLQFPGLQSIPEDFAQQVASHVARGANVARCNALHAGNTALHCAGSKQSPAAVASLLALGTDPAVVNMAGTTPFDVARKSQRSSEDFVRCVLGPTPNDVIARRRGEEMRAGYDTILVLVPPGQPPLADGCVTPRLLARLRCLASNAVFFNSCGELMPTFVRGKPLHVSELVNLLWWEPLPEEIFERDGGMVYKSFAMGFLAIVNSLESLLGPFAIPPELSSSAPKLPTVQRVMEAVESRDRAMGTRDRIMVEFFLGRGGKVEHVLETLLYTAEHEAEVMVDEAGA